MLAAGGTSCMRARGGRASSLGQNPRSATAPGAVAQVAHRHARQHLRGRALAGDEEQHGRDVVQPLVVADLARRPAANRRVQQPPQLAPPDLALLCCPA